ncbi:transposase [Frankia sp. QA3]|nr:transposase [Frankia sp. QA3]
MEDWAEIRRLHRAEEVPIKEIARRLGVARNTVRRALASDAPPKYVRAPKGSVVDPFEPAIRALLTEWPRMPAPVVAARIGWPYSLSPLKRRLAVIRPEYVGIDLVDRVVYEPGQVAQCDLWFPPTPVPVAVGKERVAPVLVMALGFSRFLTATMIPSRQAGDILAGMWLLIGEVGRVTRTLVWDREAAIGGGGRPTAPAAAFAGTLATRIRLAPPRDPEFKGLVERVNGYLETSFLPAAGVSFHPCKPEVDHDRCTLAAVLDLDVCVLCVVAWAEFSVFGLSGLDGEVMPRSDPYPSDLSDAEWVLVEPLLPPVSKDGRKEAHPRREIVNAILYVTHTGCTWRSLPRDLPPWETVYGFFARWHDKGVIARVHDALRDLSRELEGRDRQPTAGVIDSQSVKGAQTVDASTRGYDAGKKVNGRKRFIITDTLDSC